jgi:hypothetical protein
MTVAKADAQELIDAVIAMHKAESAYGCGFYGQEDWVAAYERTWELAQQMAGLSSKTDASGASNG